MAEVNEKFIYFFLFLYLKISTFVRSMFKMWQFKSRTEKKQRIVLMVASKHFGHVTFYAVSGLIRSKVWK